MSVSSSFLSLSQGDDPSLIHPTKLWSIGSNQPLTSTRLRCEQTFKVRKQIFRFLLLILVIWAVESDVPAAYRLRFNAEVPSKYLSHYFKLVLWSYHSQFHLSLSSGSLSFSFLCHVGCCFSSLFTLLLHTCCCVMQCNVNSQRCQGQTECAAWVSVSLLRLWCSGYILAQRSFIFAIFSMFFMGLISGRKIWKRSLKLHVHVTYF